MSKHMGFTRGVFWLIGVGIGLCLSLACAGLDTQPYLALQQRVDGFISALNQQSDAIKRNPAHLERLISHWVLPMVSESDMCRSILGRSVWQGLNDAQRLRFQHALRRLSIRTYRNAFTAYRYDKVVVHPGNEQANRLLVKSTVYRKGAQPLILAYRFVNKQGHWLIYDFVVSGVSLVETYRTECARLLMHQTWDEFIAHMERVQVS